LEIIVYIGLHSKAARLFEKKVTYLCNGDGVVKMPTDTFSEVIGAKFNANSKFELLLAKYSQYFQLFESYELAQNSILSNSLPNHFEGEWTNGKVPKNAGRTNSRTP